MQSHLPSQSVRFSSRCVSRSAPFLAVFVLAAQVVAQGPIIRESTNQAEEVNGSQHLVSASSAISPTEIAAPAPAQEEANLTSLQTIPFLALAAGQDASQSSSQSATTTTTTQTTTQKKKPAHRGLGIALVVVGTTALVVGAVGYAAFTGPGTFCNGGGGSGNCKTANNAALVLMPVGAGVAVTGFYFTFHR
jgi:hypothetical protein